MDAEKISVDGFNLNISDAKARNMISDKYDPDNGTYVVGDTCINDDILYICNTDIDTPEAFDPTKWDADTVGHYCSELKSNLTKFEPIDISDKFSTPFTKDYLKAFYYPQEKQVKVTFKISGCTTGSAIWLTIITVSDDTYKPIRDFMGVCYQLDTSKGMSTGVYMPNNTNTIQVFRISSNIGIYSGTFNYPID